MEKYVVFNPTKTVVSFNLKPNYDLAEFEGLAKHKVRRKVRGDVFPVTVQPNTSIDLVKLTGMSVEVIRNNSELHSFIQKGVLQILEATILATIPDEVEAPQEEEAPILEPIPDEVEEEPKEAPKEEPEEDKKPEMPKVPVMPSVPKTAPKKGAKKKADKSD